MKNLQFNMIRPGQRFWTTVAGSTELVEHIRLNKPIMGEVTDDIGIGPIVQRPVEWNAVEFNGGQSVKIEDQRIVYLTECHEPTPIVAESFYADGTKPTGRGCVQVLEIVNHFYIETRSLGGIGFNDLYDQITKRFCVDRLICLKRKVIVE